MGVVAPLVEPAWLVEHLEESDLRVIDATMELTFEPELLIASGQPAWERSHIPGSAFSALVSSDQFVATMQGLGVGDDTRVVVYDRAESMWAARVWWMLRAFGFDRAGVLDGGWTGWLAAGGDGCSEPCAPATSPFSAQPCNGYFVDKQEVLAAIGDPRTCIVNALPRRQHRGELDLFGRPGHIPGARNVSAWDLVDGDTQRYRPIDELQDLFGPVLDHERVIAYCGGGIAASSVAFVLTLLGHPDVTVYGGGLLEWCADPDMPLELGDT